MYNTIDERFEKVKLERRDISEHIDTLYEYALQCDTIVELGVNEGISTTAFVKAVQDKPEIKFHNYDYMEPNPMFRQLLDMCEKEKVNINFTEADSRQIVIPECDLLFVDTLHIYEQLRDELTLHGNKAKKWILLHDTETFKERGVVEGSMGLQAAVKEFIEKNAEWVVKKHYPNNNGLTVLERKNIKTNTKPKYLLATSAFINEELLQECIKSWPESNENLKKMVFFDGKNWRNNFKSVLKDGENYIFNFIDNYLSADKHLGASGSWNQILKYGFEDNDFDYVVIVGSDIEMKEGFWEQFLKEHQEVKPDFSCCMGFNCFVMNKKCYETVGRFDENYFPAYFEDNDLDTRVRLFKDTILYKNVGDESLLNHYGSAVIRKNDKYNNANGQTFPMNQAYHIKKWGCTPEDPGAYTFNTPYNDSSLTAKDWFLDSETYEKKVKIWDI
jgi:hypothetical protein